jgi:hypothetical protein
VLFLRWTLPPEFERGKKESDRMKKLMLFASLAALGLSAPVYASQAYGSLNNFDVVNDTGTPCHGFEVEIEDVHSRDITYTYGYNHYGSPDLVEDNSDPLHPKVIVRYASKKNPDGSWSAYTAVPTEPINPTNGHMFTNPNINFGGEHFGVGFYGVPGTVRYFWLLDDGAGNLVRGNPLSILTPVFNYAVPAPGAPAQVQAVVAPPEPPEIPVKEFGPAMWVKMTRTQTHNDNRVELRDLVSDDPEDPDDKNWKNGEPDEVEVEWQLLQTEFAKLDGGENGALENEPQELPDGDEVITIRYDFYKYVGPLDVESGEAKASKVGADDLHGEGIKEINGVDVDLSTVEVVGEYIGAQMAGFDPAGQIGLIDDLQDGAIFEPYVERSVVIGGTPPVVTTVTGELPDGMEFDLVAGVLSGTPTVSGIFQFSIHSVDSAGGDVTKAYSLKIAGDVVVDEAPVVALQNPVDGSTVHGEVSVEASAVDDIAVTNVAFTANDVLIADTVEPYLALWDTTTVPDGAYVLQALAYDGSGNEGVSETVSVTVDNATPRITSEPLSINQEVGYVYKYTVTATGNPVPTFSLVTKPVGMTVSRTTGLVRWVPTVSQMGTSSVTVRAKNTKGSVDQSWSITVVDTKRPTTPKTLVASDVTSTSLNLNWVSSTDKAGVVGYRLYEYYRNTSTDLGWRVVQDNLPTTTASVTGLLPNKVKKYRVAAFDAAGNVSALSAICTVTTLP